MSLLKASYQRPLTEGQYRGTIVSLEETEAHVTVEGKKVNAYVTIGLKLDDGRSYSCNLFEKGFRYAVINVADQLGIKDAVLPAPDEFMVGADVEFSIVKNVVDNQTYFNVDFRKPTEGGFVNVAEEEELPFPEPVR